MYSKIKKLAKKKGVSIYRVSKETGIDQKSFQDWKNKRCMPSLKNLLKLCKYFDVELSFFIGKGE